MFSAVCYGKKFGPKGYGYGQGGGALQSDCYANGWVFRAETETGTREIYPASRLLHSHYIRCACLLNSLLSEEIRSARYWPRWGYVDRAAVRYWGRGVRVPLVMLLFATILSMCVCVCVYCVRARVCIRLCPSKLIFSGSSPNLLQLILKRSFPVEKIYTCCKISNNCWRNNNALLDGVSRSIRCCVKLISLGKFYKLTGLSSLVFMKRKKKKFLKSFDT